MSSCRATNANDNDLPELATPERVAEWLGVTVKSIYHMVARGEIPQRCIMRFGTRLRFIVPELRSWFSEKRASSSGGSR